MSKSNIKIDNPTPGPVKVLSLDWSNKDIEQRIGLTGGRFTRANTFFTFIVAVILTLTFYGICFYVLEPNDVLKDLSEKFTSRGFTPYAIMLFFFWGMATLFVKWRKLLFQEKALDLAVVPQKWTSL